MAVGPQLNLIVRKQGWHANMTDMNHLGLTLQIKPEVVQPIIKKLFSEYLYSDNPLQTILSKYTTEQMVDKMEVEWQINGSAFRPILVIEDTSGGNAVVGTYGTEFDVVFDVDWFKIGDVIAPWNADYACRVMSEAVPYGTGFRYKLRFLDVPGPRGLPGKYLRVGTRWNKLYSLYGEAAERAGSTWVGTSQIAFRTRLNRLRKQYRITGDAREQVLAVGIVGSDGKMYKTWISYVEAEFWRQWYREMEMSYWYGRYATSLQDTTGYNVFSGPGIHQIVREHGHVHYYNKLTPQLLQEFIMDLYFGRLAPGPKTRKQLVLFTGEYGMLLFNEAVKESLLKNQNVFITEGTMFYKTKSDYHTNSFGVGMQFTEYKLFNGASVTVVHNPLYDDLTINGERDPNTGYPINSANILFMDLSNEGMNNIQILRRRNAFSLAYINGTVGPTGRVNGGNSAHSGDYYEMVVQDDCGIKIEDPTRLGMFIYSP